MAREGDQWLSACATDAYSRYPMKAITILDAADMTTARSPADFVVWVMRKAQELGATPEAKKYARSGHPLPKKFYDEIYPLGLFVAREFGAVPDPIVIPNLNNDNFDARIVFPELRREVFIEITRAKDGYDESRRIEVLARQGHVSVTGPITKTSGRRGAPNRVVEVENDTIRHDDILAKHLALVDHVARAKAWKQYGRDFILLVVVDDYLPFRSESDHAKLHEVAVRTLLSPDLDFARLVILGISGDLLLSYQLPRYCTDDDRAL